MFGVDTMELIIVAIAALIFIGPRDLPRVMAAAGRFIGKVRGYARHFTSGVENMMREAELEEMERNWRGENQRILAEYPADAYYPEPLPHPAATPEPLPAPDFAEQPPLPLEAPAAPDRDSTPPAERPLP